MQSNIDCAIISLNSGRVKNLSSSSVWDDSRVVRWKLRARARIFLVLLFPPSREASIVSVVALIGQRNAPFEKVLWELLSLLIFPSAKRTLDAPPSRSKTDWRRTDALKWDMRGDPIFFSFFDMTWKRTFLLYAWVLCEPFQFTLHLPFHLAYREYHIQTRAPLWSLVSQLAPPSLSLSVFL